MHFQLPCDRWDVMLHSNSEVSTIQTYRKVTQALVTAYSLGNLTDIDFRAFTEHPSTRLIIKFADLAKEILKDA